MAGHYWVVRMKDYGDWEIASKSNFVGIAWEALSDHRIFSEKNKDKLIEKLKEYYPERSDRNLTIAAVQILTFVHELDVNDIVILPTYPKDGMIYFIGTIEGPARYLEKVNDDAGAQTRRTVDWIRSVPKRSLPQKLERAINCQHRTVFNIDKHQEEIETLRSGKQIKTKPIAIDSETNGIGQLSEIQEQLMDFSPRTFEELVCATLNLKYKVQTHIGKGVADGGVDFVCMDDKLTMIKYRGQIKRISNNISNSEILQLRGTLSEGQEGIFVTTSHFTPSAINESKSSSKTKVQLIDGTLLSQIILDVYDELDDKFKKILKMKRKTG